jgi:hypothetical protein
MTTTLPHQDAVPADLGLAQPMLGCRSKRHSRCDIPGKSGAGTAVRPMKDHGHSRRNAIPGDAGTTGRPAP